MKDANKTSLPQGRSLILLVIVMMSSHGLCRPAFGFSVERRRVTVSRQDASVLLLGKKKKKQVIRVRRHHEDDASTAIASTINDNNDDDPDLLGTQIDGFPIPPVPNRDDDEELLASLRRVPIRTSFDAPLSPRSLSTTSNSAGDDSDKNACCSPLRVLIAGGGLGGLALASTLTNMGHDVYIFEKARRYKPFGGPIQIQSNALWALQQIRPALYQAVEACGVRTGDRLSGIKDGIRYDEGWLVKFDAATPAKKCGLPLTVAINRVVLQEIFLKYGVPEERVRTSSAVVGYRNLSHEDGGGVEATLEDGNKIYGDVLVGADGIWSAVRHQMLGLPMNEIGPQFATRHAEYSGYTCYTGTCYHTPDDIEDVAYKVFLGQQQYLGCTDAGHGWQHWWAFLPDPPGKEKTQDGDEMLQRLKTEFSNWSPEIHDLLDATNTSVVNQRDLFDRLPMTKEGWRDGNVVLVGDAAHPTMPNLGQGGAMAIEDAFVFGEIFRGIKHTDEIEGRLERFEKRRFVRASIAQFLSRNGSDLLVDWDKLRSTPIVGPIAMWFINVFQPLTMNYLYSSKI
jgi:zeaxanthin epoxidase